MAKTVRALGMFPEVVTAVRLAPRALVGAAVLVLLPVLCPAAAARPEGRTVAVLAEPGMPSFMADPALSPDEVVAALRRAGMQAAALPAGAVEVPSFSARRYAALILPFGNAFPRTIAASVTRFHRQGGSVISLGVPFTHPCDPAGPVGWAMYSGDPRNPVVRDPASPRMGRYCLRIERRSVGPAVWTGCATERFGARPGERFTVSAWARTSGRLGEQDCLYVRFFGAGGRFVAQSGPRFPDDAHAWTQLRQEAVAPAGTRTVDVCPAVFAPATVWLDDVALTRSDGRTNLVRDGGFEGSVRGVWSDAGHSEAYRGHDATGTGGFRTVQGCDGFAAPRAQRLLGMPAAGFRTLPPVPAICVADFPEDEVVGIAGPTRRGHVEGWSTALIRHRCARFRGALDLYASTQSPPPALALRLLVAGTARVLRERGLLGETAMRRAQAGAASLSAPVPAVVRLPERRRSPGVFPKPRAPMRDLYLLDLESLAAPDMLTFAALQGLLNRPAPRVYADDEWSADMRGWGHRLAPIEPWDLLRRFRTGVGGVVVYDPGLPATADIAVTLCGLRGWLPVQAAQLADIGPAGRRVRLPLRMDLRGRWRTEAEAFAWALRRLRPSCTDRVLCHEKQMEPLSPSAATIGTTIVDYVVQQRIFCWHLNRTWTAAERKVAAQLLATYPANTPIIGHFGPEPNGAPNLANEGEVVDLASRYAKFFVFLVSRNTSVLAGFATVPLRQRHPPVPPLDPTKVYVGAYLSDGDSPTTWYQGRQRWADPARGRVPIAWSLGPAALDLYPRPMQWFYQHATDNDCFVAACSGAGYMYPRSYGAAIRGRAAAMQEFLRLTDELMRRADLSITHIHHHPAITDADVDRYSEGVACLRGVLQDYGKVVPGYPQANRLSLGRVPVFHALTSFTPPETGTQAEQWAREIRAETPGARPGFMHFFAVVWFSTPTDVAQALDRLDAAVYQAVRPDAMAALYRQNRRRGGQEAR